MIVAFESLVDALNFVGKVPNSSFDGNERIDDSFVVHTTLSKEALLRCLISSHRGHIVPEEETP